MSGLALPPWEQVADLVSQIFARTEQENARQQIALAGGIICTDHLARTYISDPADLWWSIDMAEPCWACREDMAEDDEPLAVYRYQGEAVLCHLRCFDEDVDGDPWNEDNHPDYPDQRWCDGCDREFTVMQPIPSPKRRYCTPTCYEGNRLVQRRRPPVTHSCLHCGGTFTGRADAVTCSDACRQAASRAVRAVAG